jgi:hypothetical protein
MNSSLKILHLFQSIEQTEMTNIKQTLKLKVWIRLVSHFEIIKPIDEFHIKSFRSFESKVLKINLKIRRIGISDHNPEIQLL